MKKFITPLLCILCLSAFSQNDEEMIMKVINQVFEAMRTNDSTLLKSSFVESPNMFTSSSNAEGKSTLTKGDFQRFINIIGQPKEQVLDEPIWNEKIQIDDNLAAVWVDYAFYVDDQFSHCGVDAFHLVKLEGQWKIFHLVDTRRKIGCDIPDDSKP
ncbi:MAG: nuclear transport factor 2 family protein [Ekhidna sp.]